MLIFKFNKYYKYYFSSYNSNRYKIFNLLISKSNKFSLLFFGFCIYYFRPAKFFIFGKYFLLFSIYNIIFFKFSIFFVCIFSFFLSFLLVYSLNLTFFISIISSLLDFFKLIIVILSFFLLKIILNLI